MKLIPVLGIALCWASDSYGLDRPAHANSARREVVVVGEITGGECAFTDDGSGAIETWWDVAVLTPVRGEIDGDSLRLSTPGGALAGLRLEIADSPELQVDHQYVLRLTPRADGSGWRVLGGEEGARAVEANHAP